MTRHLSALEVRMMLARLGRVPADDVDGYVVVLVKGAEVIATVSNAEGLPTQLGILGRAVEQLAEHVAVAMGGSTRAD